MPMGSDSFKAMKLEQAKNAARARMAAHRQRMERKVSEIPERFRSAQVTEPKCIEWLSLYRTGDMRNLVLAGNNGVGKTTQAYALVHELLTAGTNCIFGSTGDLLRAVKDTYDNGGSESEIMSRYAGVAVLLMDDFGKENPSQWATEHLFDIIDKRSAANRPVIVTTNLTVQQMAERYGEPGKAIISRLMGGAVLCSMSGVDRRFHG